MPEKRGQYEYFEDGTARQLVSGDVGLAGSSAIIPVDMQSRLSQTTQTHNAVSNPASSKSAWIPCDGWDYITFSSNVAGTLKIEWSADGTNVVSDESFTTTKIARAKVALPYARLDLTATGTVTAYAYQTV